MNDIFVDTSGWGCWLDRTLSQHAAAQHHLNQTTGQGGLAVTTSLILVELTGLLTSPLRIPKPEQIRFLSALQRDPTVRIVHVDPKLEHDAWDLWRNRPDKLWSIVDCASFLVMQQRKLTQALTTDHHFEQAGFVRLLK
jgi:predicted nucleic acid-binding protein